MTERERERKRERDRERDRDGEGEGEWPRTYIVNENENLTSCQAGFILLYDPCFLSPRKVDVRLPEKGTPNLSIVSRVPCFGVRKGAR